MLINTGKSPAKFVNIEGKFFYSNATSKDIYEGWSVCDALRDKSFVAGTVIFPNHQDASNHLFVMDAASVKAWKEWKPGMVGAPMIVGCIDYIFGESPVHHQTRFIYELDKPGSARNFYRLDSASGQIPANEVALAVNPLLAKDAD